MLESTFIPLELVFEHRNYLPSIGIILAAISLLNFAFQYIHKLKLLRIVIPVIWIFALAFTTHGRAEHWENPITLALFDVENHPNSSRTNIMAGIVYMQAALHAKSESDKLSYANQADHYFLTAIDLEKRGLSSSIGRIISLYLLKKPVEKEFFNKIVDDLKIKQVGPSTQSSLMSLIDCQIERVCKLPEQYLASLINSALNNPYLTSKNKASLLVTLAKYYGNNLGDLVKAEKLVLQAISTDQDTIRYRLILAIWHIHNKKYENAQAQLDILKELDYLNINSHDISKWQTILIDKKNSSG